MKTLIFFFVVGGKFALVWIAGLIIQRKLQDCSCTQRQGLSEVISLLPLGSFKFDSGCIINQGLKITEKKVLPWQ